MILFWSPPFGTVSRIGNMEGGCVETYDRTAIEVAKAVVFHFADIQDTPYWLPVNQRKASQKYVIFTWSYSPMPSSMERSLHRGAGTPSFAAKNV